jgi:hypothetical protein
LGITNSFGRAFGADSLSKPRPSIFLLTEGTGSSTGIFTFRPVPASSVLWTEEEILGING